MEVLPSEKPFREDPGFLSLDDVSVTTGGGPNLLLNGGFELDSIGLNAPTDWFGAQFAGTVQNNNPHTGSNNYFDGATQAYDGITQAIATTLGTTYTITFWLDDNSGLTTFSRLSTNGNVTDTGGNGADLLVYPGAIPTLSPEPLQPSFWAAVCWPCWVADARRSSSRTVPTLPSASAPLAVVPSDNSCQNANDYTHLTGNFR